MQADRTDAGPVTERGLARVITLPPPSPGFIGEGHTAIHVVDARDFALNDPFILLADDRLDLPPGNPAGGAHPHAGFEIATFVVDGELRDRDEGVLRTGDVAWMTAGSGVIHNEEVEPLSAVRILQLWVKLPSESRWAAPTFEVAARDAVPIRQQPGIEARVYSGTSGSVAERPHTLLPLTMVDIRLSPNAVFDQALPASYNGFLYPLEGDVAVGTSRVAVGQIGWLAPADGASTTNLRAIAGEHGARVVLYAGERQGVPIVTHGPFVGESREDLLRAGWAYSQGKLPRVSDLHLTS